MNQKDIKTDTSLNDEVKAYRIIMTDDELLLVTSSDEDRYQGCYYNITEDVRGIGYISKLVDYIIISQNDSFVELFSEYYELTTKLSDSSTT